MLLPEARSLLARAAAGVPDNRPLAPPTQSAFCLTLNADCVVMCSFNELALN